MEYVEGRTYCSVQKEQRSHTVLCWLTWKHPTLTHQESPDKEHHRATSWETNHLIRSWWTGWALITCQTDHLKKSQKPLAFTYALLQAFQMGVIRINWVCLWPSDNRDNTDSDYFILWKDVMPRGGSRMVDEVPLWLIREVTLGGVPIDT